DVNRVGVGVPIQAANPMTRPSSSATKHASPGWEKRFAPEAHSSKSRRTKRNPSASLAATNSDRAGRSTIHRTVQIIGRPTLASTLPWFPGSAWEPADARLRLAAGAGSMEYEAAPLPK